MSMAAEASTPKETKRHPSSPTGASKSPKRQRTDPSTPMDISPEPVNSVSRFLKIGGGLHFEEMKGFNDDILMPEIDSFAAIVQTIVSSEDIGSKTEAATQLKLLISKGHVLPIVFAMEANLVPKLLISLADANSPKLQYMLTSIVADITLGKNIQNLLENDVIGSMTKILCCDSLENKTTKEEAVRALGNIAGDSEETRLLVIEAALKPLLYLYLKTPAGPDNLSLVNMLKWTIMMLYNGTTPLDLPNQDIISVAKELLLSQVSAHKDVACQTLYFVTQDACEKVLLTIAEDKAIISSVESLLQFPSRYTVSVLKLIPKIMPSVWIENALPFLNKLLQSSETKFLREVCHTITSLATSYKQDIIDAGLVISLLNASNVQQCEDLKNLALATISKITQPDEVKEIKAAGEDEFAEYTEDEDEDHLNS